MKNFNTTSIQPQLCACLSAHCEKLLTSSHLTFLPFGDIFCFSSLILLLTFEFLSCPCSMLCRFAISLLSLDHTYYQISVTGVSLCDYTIIWKFQRKGQGVEKNGLQLSFMKVANVSGVSNILHIRLLLFRFEMLLHRLTYLNTWSPFGGSVTGGYGTVRRCNLVERSMSLSEDFEGLLCPTSTSTLHFLVVVDDVISQLLLQSPRLLITAPPPRNIWTYALES